MKNRAMYVSRPATSWRLDACASAIGSDMTFAAAKAAKAAKATHAHKTHKRLRAWSPPLI